MNTLRPVKSETGSATATIRGVYRRVRWDRRLSPPENFRHAWRGLPRRRRRSIIQAIVVCLVGGFSVVVAFWVGGLF